MLSRMIIALLVSLGALGSACKTNEDSEQLQQLQDFEPSWEQSTEPITNSPLPWTSEAEACEDGRDNDGNAEIVFID